MKTQIEKLRELSDKKKSVVMNQYVDDLLRNGKAYTVRSRYSGGYYYKKSYTEELDKLLTEHGISHEIGNDAPRGGMNGEFVSLKGTVLKYVLKCKREREELWKTEQERKDKQRALAYERYKQECEKTYKFCVENNIEIDFSYFTEKDNERFFHFDYDYIKKEILGYKISIPKRFYGMASRYSGVQSNEGFRRYVKEKLLSSGLSHEGRKITEIYDCGVGDG